MVLVLAPTFFVIFLFLLDRKEIFEYLLLHRNTNIHEPDKYKGNTLLN